MKYYQYEIWDKKTTLAHHGVEGQKWGKRHGPPYPLDSKISTGNKLKSGARAKTILKTAGTGALIGGIAGGIVGGPIGAGLSAGASAGLSAIKATWMTRKKKNKYANNDDYKAEASIRKASNKYPVKNETIKSVQSKVAKYAANTPWGKNGGSLDFIDNRVIELPNGKKSYEFVFANNNAMFTVYGKYKNGKLVLDKTKNGSIDVAIDD